MAVIFVFTVFQSGGIKATQIPDFQPLCAVDNAEDFCWTHNKFKEVNFSSKNTNYGKGDANDDGSINIQDVIATINSVLNSGIQNSYGDCTTDGSVNIQDVICTINIVLGEKSGPPSNQNLYIGIGGYEFCSGANGEPTAYNGACPNDKKIFVDEVVKEVAPNVNAVTFWVNRDWEEHWYDIDYIQTKIIDQGYTPVFFFYWFADDISPQFVEQRKADYLIALKRMISFINQLEGEKIVILNPEFNKNGVEGYEPFNDLLIESIRLVKQVKQTKVSFCIGDFGDYQMIADEEHWQDFHPSIYRAVQYVDFITFQEMRGSTRNQVEEIINTPERSLAFAKYLTETYKKPTYLAFLALSSYGQNGLWLQEQVYQEFSEIMSELVRQGNLIGFNSFHLMDVPRQAGYFNEAEKYFGLFDAQGKPKPALKQFQKIVLN